MTETSILVGGMNCGACVTGVTMALERLPGVKKVEVDLKAGRAVVKTDGEPPGEDTLRRALDDAGYEYGGPG